MHPIQQIPTNAVRDSITINNIGALAANEHALFDSTFRYSSACPDERSLTKMDILVDRGSYYPKYPILASQGQTNTNTLFTLLPPRTLVKMSSSATDPTTAT